MQKNVKNGGIRRALLVESSNQGRVTQTLTENENNSQLEAQLQRGACRFGPAASATVPVV